MTYLKLKNNRIRISLTKYETEQIFGSSDKLDKDDPKTNLALKMLFKRAASDNNLELSADSVWIEVARNLSGGYDIYFIKSGASAMYPKAPVLIFEFSSLNTAIKASRAVAFVKCKTHFSRFYNFFGKYRMIVLSKTGACNIPAVFEFADSLLTSRIDVAKTIEYGRLLIKDNAVEVLSKL